MLQIHWNRQVFSSLCDLVIKCCWWHLSQCRKSIRLGAFLMKSENLLDQVIFIHSDRCWLFSYTIDLVSIWSSNIPDYSEEVITSGFKGRIGAVASNHIHIFIVTGPNSRLVIVTHWMHRISKGFLLRIFCLPAPEKQEGQGYATS